MDTGLLSMPLLCGAACGVARRAERAPAEAGAAKRRPSSPMTGAAPLEASRQLGGVGLGLLLWNRNIMSRVQQRMEAGVDSDFGLGGGRVGGCFGATIIQS